MTRNTNANTNDPGSQRKRSANQPRANVASQNNQQSQQNSKKGNKQHNQQNNQNQNQNQSQSAAKPPSAAAATTTTTTITTTTPAAPSTPLPAVPTTPTITQPDESYVPLPGFNGDDIDRLLKNGFDEKALTYKSEQPAAQQKTSPWSQKPGSMANGKDFWLELRKQVISLQKGESTNKGG